MNADIRTPHFGAATASTFVNDAHQPRAHTARVERDKNETKRRWWVLNPERRDAILGSDAVFLLSVVMVQVFSGVFAYFYAQWTIGPT